MMKINSKIIYRTAPLTFPVYWSIAGGIIMSFIIGFNDLGNSVMSMIWYGIGFIPVTVIIGIFVAVLDCFLHRFNKFMMSVFFLGLISTTFFSWVLVQSMLHH